MKLRRVRARAAFAALTVIVTVGSAVAMVGAGADASATARRSTLPADAGTSPGTVAASEVTSVSATKKAIVVTGQIGAGTSLAGTSLSLYRLGPSDDGTAYQSLTPDATLSAPLASASFRFAVPRYRGADDGYFDKYLVTQNGPSGSQPLGAAQYPAAEFPPRYSYPYPHGWDKKGISAVQMTDDAETLGASSSAVNVAVNQIMLASDLDPANTITFWSDGQPYYFSRPAVSSLDAQLKVLTRDRIYPYLILLITPGDPVNSAGPQLRFPGADASANIDAFNTKTPAGVAYLTASMRFLASRYLRADAAYGQAAGFIVGNEVDSAWIWQNMGQQTLSTFLEYYARAVRIVYQAARLEYPAPRVYISLDHEWAVPYMAGQPLEYYPGKDVVDGLAALTRTEGDFGWDIAYHPYPQNLADPAFWNDTQATDSADSPLITFKNLQVLPDYLRDPAVTYNGQPRRVILSEQGFNTPDDSERSQLLQAAAFAYAYYKVRFLPGVDAFLYYRHVDNQGEGGLRLGLWTWDSGASYAGAPGRPKYIYDVYRYIDTRHSLQVTNFALPIIGITSWSQAIPGFNPAELAQRPLDDDAGTRVFATPSAERVISSFDSGTSGWLPAENAGTVTTDAVPGYGSGHALVVNFASPPAPWSAEALTAKGADLTFSRPLDASATPWLDLAVQVPSAPPGQYHVIVKAYGRDGRVAEGTALITPGSGWLPLSVDLAGWQQVRSVSRIKVWVQGSGDQTWRGSYDIGQVGFSAAAAPSADTNVDITATAAQHAPAAGTSVTVSVTNDDVSALDGMLAVGTCPDVAVTPSSVSLAGLAAGQVKTFAVTLTAYQPSSAPSLCLSYGGESFTVPLALPPPAPHTLYSFGDGSTDGWQAASNVASVAAVTSFADAPGVPYGGSGYALDATADGVPASTEKSVAVTFAPLDLSSADTVFAYLDCYGGAPGATGYQATITLSSGSQTLTKTIAVQHDAWNELSVDISSWPYRDSVTGISVSFAADGSTTPWAPHFQLDDVGYTS